MLSLQPQQEPDDSPAPARRKVTIHSLVFFSILVLGAAFRFADLGSARFGYDHAYPIYDALRILDGRELLLVGQPSSVFLDNPPLMSYLQTIPLMIWRSPWAVYIFIVALNTLAIGFVYRVSRQLLGEATGLLAAFLFAVNPWLAMFSRATWVQALLPFFTAVIAWGLWPAPAAGRASSRRVLVALLAVIAMMLTYIQAWGVLVQVGLLILIFRKRIPIRPLLAGALALTAALTVYGAGLAGDWEANYAKLLNFISGNELRLTSEGVEHAARLVTGQDFEAAQIQASSGRQNVREAAASVVAGSLSAALVAGVFLSAFAIRRRTQYREVAIVLLIWFATPILMTSIASRPVHPHYLLLSCPAGHVLAAWGASPLWSRARARWLAILTLVSAAILFGFGLHAVNQDAARHPTPPEFDGWTLEAAAYVGSTLSDLAESHAYPIRIIANGHSALLSGMSGKYVRSLQGIHYPNFVVLPGNDPLLYVLDNVLPQPGALGPREQAFPERGRVFADGGRVSFLKVSPYSREDAHALPQVLVNWPSEAGLSLLGYTLGGTFEAGQTIECVTYWRVDELLPGREAWFVGAFYHVVNAGGQIIVNVSGHGQWSRRWQPGDVYVERVRIPLPADPSSGASTLRIGLYDSIHAQNYAFLPDGGRVQTIDITP